MKRTIHLVAVLALLASPAAAADEGDDATARATEILEKVDAAIKAVNSVKFNSETAAEGGQQPRGGARGTVILSGWNGQTPQEFWVEVEGERPDGGTVHFTAAGNGENYYLIDHVDKKAYEDIDPGVLGSAGNMMQGLIVLEFVHDRPYDDELNADVKELLGTETIDDQECYKIHVIYAAGQGETYWYFSTEDYLPRRRVIVLGENRGGGTVQRTVTDLQVGFELDDSLFVMKLPDGYQRVDDFAP